MTTKLDRRSFLQGSSLAVLTAMLPATGAFAAIGPAPAFNDGRSQVNLNVMQVGGDYPFLNCLKTAQIWSLGDNSGPPDPSTLDANGYPTTITKGGVYTVFFVPSQEVRPGNFVITWSGNGTVRCGMGNTAVSGSTTSTNGRGRYVFSTRDTRFVIGIASIGSPYITDLKVFHERDEAALNAGEVFGAKFKERLAEAKFGVIRFLNWQHGNTTNVTSWATRKPMNYVFYAGQEFRRELYAGLTRNNGAAYSANLSGFSLADKATVIVKFNASTNGPCTLNVNGTGNIKIISSYSAALSTTSYPIGNAWQSLATLVYDEKLNAWIKQGGDAALGSRGIDNGCPPELMVRLCAEVGAHPHFVTPPFAIDPATDYMPKLAAYCRDSGPTWMVPRFEGPNELWNYASGFYQTAYARAKATAYGWGDDPHNWYGKVVSVLGQIVSSAYGNNRSRYQVLCGVQTGTAVSMSGASASNARLSSAKYVSQAEPPQAPFTKSPASRWVTTVCCANYYAPSAYNTAQELTDSARYLISDTKTQTELAVAYANTSNSGNGTFTLIKLATLYANWKAWAIANGVMRMCGYEGGYSPDYGSNTTLNQFRAASKLAQPLYNMTLMNYNSFVGLSGNGFVAEFPSCFQLSGSAPTKSAWSVLEDVYQSPNPPQWEAIVQFNKTSYRAMEFITTTVGTATKALPKP